MHRPLTATDQWDTDPEPLPSEQITDLPNELAPDWLAAHPGPSAEDRGWVVGTDAEMDLRRRRATRHLTSIERQVQIMKLYHRGTEVADIAEIMGLTSGSVWAIVRGAQRKALRRVGAQQEREHQIQLTEAILNRLAERMFPDANDDGFTVPIDPKVVDAAMKVLNRRAALTGADAPNKLVIDGEIIHRPDQAIVDKVSEYMDLADAILNTGYGSGRLPAGHERIIDAEVIDVKELPPPAPPEMPWVNKVTEPDSLVEKAEHVPQPPVRGTFDLDEDPEVRALRLPTPDPDSNVISSPRWGVGRFEDDPHSS